MKAANLLKKLWRDENGGEAVEWALIVGLLFVVALATWQAVGTQTNAFLGRLINHLSSI